MAGLSPKLPRVVPIFTELQERGLKRAHLHVYGAIVAFEREQYVPTCADIARLAGLNGSDYCRDVQKHIKMLIRERLLQRVEYENQMVRYVPLGPRLQSWLSAAPANDNGSAT